MKIATQPHKTQENSTFTFILRNLLNKLPSSKLFSYLPKKTPSKSLRCHQDTDPYGYRPSLVPMVPRALDVVSTEGSYWTPSAWHKRCIAWWLVNHFDFCWSCMSVFFLVVVPHILPTWKLFWLFGTSLRKKHMVQCQHFSNIQCMFKNDPESEKKQCSILLLRCLFIFCQQFRFGSQKELIIWCFMKFNPFIGWGRFFSIH